VLKGSLWIELRVTGQVHFAVFTDDPAGAID
jgi:hypothetical protein